jgi:hypothetical protein
VSMANIVYNMMLHKANNSQSPLEAFTGKAPRLDHIHVFGCNVHVLVQPSQQTKLGNWLRPGIYLGPVHLDASVLYEDTGNIVKTCEVL